MLREPTATFSPTKRNTEAKKEATFEKKLLQFQYLNFVRPGSDMGILIFLQ